MLFGPNYRKEEYLIWGKDKMFGVFLYRRRLISALEPPPAVDWILGIHKLSKLKREKKKRNQCEKLYLSKYMILNLQKQVQYKDTTYNADWT